MNITMGKLTFLPWREREDLAAAPVTKALNELRNTEEVLVSEIDSSLSDTAAFCEKYETGPETAANCVIVKAKRAEREWHAAVVILGTTRADINGAVRKHLDARKVSFAPMEEAVRLTGMEHGAITPVGLPADWPILIDSRVVESGRVIIGSGLRASKLSVPGSFLSQISQAAVLVNLAVLKQP